MSPKTIFVNVCVCVCECVAGLGRPLHDRAALRILHLRDVRWVKKADEVTQEGGAVTNDQVNCDDTDDSWNKTHQMFVTIFQHKYTIVNILHYITMPITTSASANTDYA